MNKISLILTVVMVSLPTANLQADERILQIDPTLLDQFEQTRELLIQYDDAIQSQDTAIQMASMVAKIRPLSGLRHQLIQLQDDVELADAIKQLRQQDGVAHVQPNYQYHASALPSDPLLEQQWALNNDGLTINSGNYQANNPPRRSGYDIDAPGAWDLISDCSEQVIAIVDTGIHYGHSDLRDNMWTGNKFHGWDFVEDDADPMPTSAHENHGTHVAGIIAASGDNGLGSAGVCWQAQIMSVRVLDENGNGNSVTLGEGIRWAVDQGASIINMSLGGSGGYDAFLESAIEYAREQDVLVITSAGNSQEDNDLNPHWPCSFEQDNLVCVTALDQAAELAWFANYGSHSVDLAAPGTNILSTWTGPSIEAQPNSWQLDSPWTTLAANTCASYEMLVLPSDWCSRGEYDANTTALAWQRFNLSAYSMASLEFAIEYDLEPTFDFIQLRAKPDGGRPMTGEIIWSASGNSGRFLPLVIRLDNCLTQECSLGFLFDSDNDVEQYGVGIGLITVETFEQDTEAVKVTSGTSMATPIVTGIAGLIRSFQPGYSASDTAEALRNGGQMIEGLQVKSGKSAHAHGSLTWLKPPEGLTAVVTSVSEEITE